MIKETLIVGERGQITIPKSIREKYGIKPKQPVIIEEKDGEIVIKPVITISKPTLYKLTRDIDKDLIDEIIKENELTKEEERKILNKWKK